MHEVSSSWRDVMSAATFDPSKCVPARLVLSPDERADIEACIESLLAILDISEDDPDLEDGEASNPHIDERGNLMPGAVYVPTSQNEDYEHSGDECDYTSWPEWHTLPPQQRRAGNFAGRRLANLPWWQSMDEGVEMDDPDTGVENSPKGFDPEEDYCLAGDDRIMGGPVNGPGLVSDRIDERDDPDLEISHQPLSLNKEMNRRAA